MAGVNPYIKAPETEKAEQKFTVEFRSGGKNPESIRTIEVDPQDPPTGGIGLPGSILDIAMGCDVDIDHACGGVAACSTCHVIVREGLDSCNPSEEAEDDQLEKAPGLTAQSRLACQTVPNGRKKLVVEIPTWNRNLVREGS